jgi:hypothetical protein
MHRFHHYDCLVVPVSAVSDHSCFLWEKVSLLVEYEPLKSPLFSAPSAGQEEGEEDMGAPSDCSSVMEKLHLQEYISLRTVLDLSSDILLSTGWWFRSDTVARPSHIR